MKAITYTLSGKDQTPFFVGYENRMRGENFIITKHLNPRANKSVSQKITDLGDELCIVITKYSTVLKAQRAKDKIIKTVKPISKGGTLMNYYASGNRVVAQPIFTEEQREKMSVHMVEYWKTCNHPKAKPVMIHGKFYETLTKASLALDMDIMSLRYRIIGDVSGYYWYTGVDGDYTCNNKTMLPYRKNGGLSAEKGRLSTRKYAYMIMGTMYATMTAAAKDLNANYPTLVYNVKNGTKGYERIDNPLVGTFS